jgi:hypothetical protein
MMIGESNEKETTYLVAEACSPLSALEGLE